MKHLIISLCAVLTLLSGCASHKKVTEAITVEHSETTTNVTEKSSEVTSTDTSVKNDILDDYDLTFEFTRLDFGEAVIPEDSTYRPPVSDNVVAYNIPWWLYNAALPTGTPSLTKGKLTLTGKHSDKSTSESKEESKTEDENEMSVNEEADSENHQSDTVAGLSFWEQFQIWGFRVVLPLLLLALLWIVRKPILRLLTAKRT